MSPAKLGVNIDHVATLRQARGTTYPDILAAARAAVAGGADQITIHLREDRRHIQDSDVALLRSQLHVPLNLEMAATEEMLGKAIECRPHRVTLVPEKRQELTTEGGLDVAKKPRRLKKIIERLQAEEIPVSLFIDPDESQLKASVDLGVKAIELHTGRYADRKIPDAQAKEKERLIIAARYGTSLGLFVAAGHGLTVDNMVDLVSIEEIREYNIGHSIIARAVFIGLEAAVREMKLSLNRGGI